MRRAKTWLLRRRRESIPPAPAHVELAINLAGRQIHLVLGMDWHTILGKDLASQARRRARQLDATHWVHAGGRSESVGTLARIAGRRVAAGELHSAAQMFARTRVQGMHALAWRLDDGRFWLALVREGQVLEGGDRIFASSAEASGALHAAWLRFDGTLQCWAEAAGLLAGIASDSAQSQPAGLEPGDLASAASAGTLLQRTPSAARGWPAWGGALGVIAAVAWGMQRWSADAPPSLGDENGPLALETAVQDHQLLWRQHMADAIGRISVPSAQGLAALWHAIGALPIQPAGWLLNDVQCASEHGKKWECRAGYRRLWRIAGNQGLLDALNPGCVLRWDTLDAATAICTVDVDARALDPSLLAVAEQRLFPDADAIQTLRPLLSRLEVGPPRPVVLAAPTDLQGTSVPMPAGLARLHERSIQAYGPLRTMALMGPALTRRIAWRGLAVSMQPGAEAGAATSILMATLSGVAYESRP